MDRDKSSLRQLLAVLFAALLSPMIQLLPGHTVEFAGRAAFLAPLAALPGALALMWAYGRCLEDAPGGMAQALTRAFGRWTGKGLTALYFAGGAVLLGLNARWAAFRFLATSYGNGPLPFFIVVLLGLAVWLGLGKRSAFARAGTVFSFALGAALVLTLLFALPQVHPEALLPMWTADVPGVLRGGGAVLSLLGYGVFAAFCAPGVSRRRGDRGRLFRWAVFFCGLLTFFSLLRRYKAETLWKNSMLRRLVDVLSESTFKYRLTTGFMLYLGANVFLITLGAFMILREEGEILRSVPFLTLMVIWVLGNLMVFYYLYRNAEQTDRLHEAIEKLASGETSYKVDVSRFSSLESQLAEGLNRISDGLETALAEQVKSERLKADLITNVSHDIKTPLTSIINYVDLLKRENIENPTVQQYLEILDQKSQRLKTLTEDLVEASRASSGNIKLDIADIDLVELVQQTTGEFEDRFSARHLELVNSLPNEVILIEADGRRLWRVLENLYNNAYKYALENTRVYASVEDLGSEVVFTIKNISSSPLNISPEELTERFVRGDVSRTTEGSGLGLSIAKDLTALQGGKLEITIDGDLFKASVTFPIKN